MFYESDCLVGIFEVIIVKIAPKACIQPWTLRSVEFSSWYMEIAKSLLSLHHYVTCTIATGRARSTRHLSHDAIIEW